MALSAGTRFGPYEVAGEIGAGGMGVVYRATDTNLKRSVAIKVLPESLAADRDGLARFQREAEMLASLNHPNIGQIYGLEQSDGTTALILELIEGPTLADRIEEGPIRPDDALDIAMQIADGLEGAHGQGIVHRDLKPANIKLRPDGTVKVLDFGISKALQPQMLTDELQATLASTPVTQAGIILGTAAYMSPEQARGKPVDQRADIWAFGCLLYEMLTGQPAFGGEDFTVTLARVLERDTDLDALPAGVSPAVRQTIELCLQKDVRRRVADIRDVRLALDGAFETVSPLAAGADAAAQPIWRRPLPVAAAAILATGLVAGLTAWNLWPTPEPQPLIRFDYELPEGRLFQNPTRSVIALSPDGRHFVYLAQEGLYLREMGELEARLIAGMEEAGGTPFFSPDGQSVAAFGFDNEMRRISINGGAASTITDIGAPFGASWGPDDTILYGQAEGIMRVSANGGTAELVIPAEINERLHGPELLPDGDSVLFSIGTTGNWDTAQIVAESLSTGERTELIDGGSDAHYLSTGHLVYAFEDGLFAVAFNPDSLTVAGGAVPLVQGVVRATATGAANYGISNDGTLVYVTGGAAGLRSLVWVDREGREEAIPAEISEYVYPRISPDGTRVALDDRTADNDIWVWDFVSETRIRLTLGENGGTYPVWTPDGTRIAYDPGTGDIAWKAANNTGRPESLAAGLLSPAGTPPHFFSPSGDALVFRAQSSPETGNDIGMISVGSNAETIWLLREPYQERNAELSPDGRWMAYQSDESGRWQIYVRPFPDVEDNLWQVSNAGGLRPLWSRDGQELFFLEPGPPERLMAAAIEATETTFSFGSRTPILDWPYLGASGPGGRTYDVSPDGQKFLALKEGGSEGTTQQIIVVQNWFEELRRLAPPVN